jgi:hypothetical protein
VTHDFYSPPTTRKPSVIVRDADLVGGGLRVAKNSPAGFSGA